MKWAKQSAYLAISNTLPAYKVAKFIVDGAPLYRASVGGEFIGQVCSSPKDAQAICDNHLAIMGNKEVAA
jgi:hypothetical protein